MLSKKHLLRTTDLTYDDFMQILQTAVMFEEVNERRIKKVPALRGRTVVNMFFEPSTRTRGSFELAEKRLSCDTMNMGGSTSSTVKGESLKDTILTLNAMKVDCYVVRSSHAGAPAQVAKYTDACVIDAGDGKHQHPTQALLDLYTIWRRKGSFEGLRVGIVGDIAHSRVCGSLVPALKILGAHVTLIAPQTLLPARPDVLGADAVTADMEAAWSAGKTAAFLTTWMRPCPSSTWCTCCACRWSVSRARRSRACASTTCFSGSHATAST